MVVYVLVKVRLIVDFLFDGVFAATKFDEPFDHCIGIVVCYLWHLVGLELERAVFKAGDFDFSHLHG